MLDVTVRVIDLVLKLVIFILGLLNYLFQIIDVGNDSVDVILETFYFGDEVLHLSLDDCDFLLDSS